MAKPGNGGSERQGQAGGGAPNAPNAPNAPRKPAKTFPLFPRSPERALVISSALTVFSFLSHIIFLLLVDPWRVLNIPKEDALTYSTIPLVFGVVFLLSSIYSFIKIDSRSIFHFILLIFAVAFGSFSFHGLLGFVHHYLNLIVLSSYPR
ncbi:MAG: hypothetical protein ACRECZ_03640 [Methylocella sp.]